MNDKWAWEMGMHSSLSAFSLTRRRGSREIPNPDGVEGHDG